MSAGFLQHLDVFHLKIILIFKIRLFVIPPIQPVVYEWLVYCMVTCEVILDHDGIFPAFQFNSFFQKAQRSFKIVNSRKACNCCPIKFISQRAAIFLVSRRPIICFSIQIRQIDLFGDTFHFLQRMFIL